ncbi:hypothetical protein CVD25_04375 [Bacillus canaveralius]|uniref:YqgU-like 6-bladed beta-propeller domain-containing protein n=1 Tax=Bacillus canaveralius TaxID=1403243 RepID=A0A2N5GR79_9BACI|nr:hypothetical protein [Bacillus canaveralius]PLR85956.1 hypothetical protein CU635_02665 [Bacillus canaveralius]PLS00075.1 hypothetical protein CVD25_04375 [Bacillus canaveralius]RSK50547.1 hypothetical protein EJA13_14725 [Bacillus canaveralius]
MGKRKTTRKKYYNFIFLFCIIIFTTILSSCSQEKESEPHSDIEEKDIGKNPPAPTFWDEQAITPIKIPDGAFNRVNGWIDNETVLFTTNLSQGSNVFTYNLRSGESSLLYESRSPIVDVHISPSKRQFLIHSAPSTYAGVITVLDRSGKETFSKQIESFELALEWNPYDENAILVSSFAEDWTYSTYLLNVSGGELTKVNLPEPFAHWLNKKELVFLDWDENNPGLLAPLVKKEIDKPGETALFENIIEVSTFKNLLITVSVNREKPDQAIYTFLSNDLKKVASISFPHLSTFSGWLVPHFDFMETARRFITFRPLSSGEADNYASGFQLVSHDLKSGDETIYFQGMDNEPISCSPDGMMCLVGYQLEKLLILNAKKVIPLTKTDV